MDGMLSKSSNLIPKLELTEEGVSTGPNPQTATVCLTDRKQVSIVLLG
jgi:hypothetical protein